MYVGWKEYLADNVEEIGGSWGEGQREVPESMRLGERYLEIIPRTIASWYDVVSDSVHKACPLC